MLSECLELDLNEMPYPPPESVIEAARTSLKYPNRYAEPGALDRLAELLAEDAGVRREQIGPAPGSDLLLRELVMKERERLQGELEISGAVVYPSSTNFLLIRSRVPGLAEELREEGVLVLDLTKQLGPGYLRVAVRTPEQNDAFVQACREAIRRHGEGSAYDWSAVRAEEPRPMITFGPVPSRRLGRSLGVNNIPYKVCTYSCVYCQVGRTKRFQVERTPFYEPEAIVREVRKRTSRLREMGEAVDYLTFVPDGEPTLDANLATTIELLKPLGIRIAVITNGSLLGSEDGRDALVQADWVSFKLDSVTDPCWDRVNRPHGALRLDGILEGMLEFRKAYRGILATETMLVRELNDGDGNLNSIAAFLGRLKPEVVYLSIPTRPPAENWVRQPAEETVARAHQILGREVARVEHLIGYEGNAFSATGKAEDDLLAITAVHPMREEAVSELLEKTQADRSVVREMVGRGLLVETQYEGRKYFVRKFPRRRRRI